MTMIDTVHRKLTVDPFDLVCHGLKAYEELRNHRLERLISIAVATIGNSVRPG